MEFNCHCFYKHNNNSIVDLLSSGNQNTIGQVLTSLSQELNRINMEIINRALSNGLPLASISISPLSSQSQSSNTSFNQSALVEFNRDLNSQANIREYLISFTQNLLITTSNSIKLQSSSLVQLIESTSALTRTTLSIAADRCYLSINISRWLRYRSRIWMGKNQVSRW